MELPIPAQQLGHRCLGLGDLGRLNLEEHLGARQMIGVVGDEKVALSLVQSSPKHCVLFWTKNVLSHLVFCLRCLWICCHCLSKCLLNVVIVLAVRSIYPPSAIRRCQLMGTREGVGFRGRFGSLAAKAGPMRAPGPRGRSVLRGRRLRPARCGRQQATPPLRQRAEPRPPITTRWPRDRARSRLLPFEEEYENLFIQPKQSADLCASHLCDICNLLFPPQRPAC